MSIADKLTQLATIRSNIRAKLTEKGVEASEHNFSDFASDIESIPSGGGIDTSVLPNQVKMLVQINDQVKDCYVLFKQTVAHGVEVDWGDGSPIETSDSTSQDRAACATIPHSYSEMGAKVITLTGVKGTFNVFGNNGFMSFAGARGTVNGNQYPNNCYRGALIGIYFGDDYDSSSSLDLMSTGLIEAINVNNAGLASSSSLLKITFNPKQTRCASLPASGKLMSIKVPPAISIAGNFVRDNISLRIADFTDWTIEDIRGCTWGSYAFHGCYSISIIWKDEATMNVAKSTTNLSAYGDFMTFVGA